MNLHLLRAFAAVAAQKSFSRAADSIHVSQPAVSKAVRELESQLNIALLERQGRQVRLTEAGATLYGHAQAIFALEEAAVADLRARQGLERGSLTVGASMATATFMLPALIARFLDRYPMIEVKIVSGNTGAVEQRLLDYEVDVAFIERPSDNPRVDQAFWREDELVILAPAGHPLLARECVRTADLDGQRWIVREEGSGTRAVTQQLLREAGVAVRQALEVSGNGAVIHSVGAGLGLAITSATAAGEHILLGKIGIIRFPIRFMRTLYRVRLRDKPSSPAARAFEELAHEAGAITSRPRSHAP